MWKNSIFILFFFLILFKMDCYAQDNYSDYVDVTSYGVNGNDDKNDTLNLKNIHSDFLYFPSGTYIVDTSYASELRKKSLCGSGKIQFTNWTMAWYNKIPTNVYTGICDLSYYNDELYMSAHWPSDVQVVEEGRTNIAASQLFTLDNERIKINYQGGVKRIYGKELPDKFTICIGKCNLFGYKNNQWIILDSSYPSVGLYDASWKNKDQVYLDKYVKKYDDHIEIEFTKEQWLNNGDERVYHFYSKRNYELKSDEIGYDYKYFITTADAWIKEPQYEDIFGFCIGSDSRDFNNNIYEIGLGKNYALKSYKTTAYFYNVPDTLYPQIIQSDFYFQYCK